MASRRTSKSVDRKHHGHQTEVSGGKQTRKDSIPIFKAEKEKDEYSKRIIAEKAKHHKSRTETKKSSIQSNTSTIRKPIEVLNKERKSYSIENKFSTSNEYESHSKAKDKKTSNTKNYKNHDVQKKHSVKDDSPQTSIQKQNQKTDSKQKKHNKASNKDTDQSNTYDTKDSYKSDEIDKHRGENAIIAQGSHRSEDEEYNYSDDFENYSSDFEDSEDDSDQMQVPNTNQHHDDMQNITSTNLENANKDFNVAASLPSTSDIKENDDLDLSPGLTTLESSSEINITKEEVLAKEECNKVRQRGEILLSLVTLDQVAFDLYSSPPTNYDEFMTTFGGVNIKQACLQTGEDDVPEESQTDLIEYHDIWTQYPPDIGGAIGGALVDKQTKDNGIRNWRHLSMFINEASRVMCAILEESYHIHTNNSMNNSSGQMDFNSSFATLQPPEFRKDSCIACIACSKLHSHVLLAVYDTPTQLNSDEVVLYNRGVLCVWNVHQPSRPQKILICASRPLCCSLDDNAEIAFAGMEDGSLALWDLREPDFVHHIRKIESLDWVLRAPTYSSAKVAGEGGHHSPVVAVVCGKSSYISSDITSTKTTGVIHLATLEEQAVLHIWIVRESNYNELITDFDLGLAPYGHVHLIKSATINLQAIPSLQQRLQNHPRVLDFKCRPQDSSKIYIATDMGIIVSCSPYDEKCRIFCPSSEPDAEITSLDFYENAELQYFLAGSSSGNLSLYNTSKEKPIMVWNSLNENLGVVKVKWSTSTPNIFYVLYTDGRVQLWDLKRNSHKPTLMIGNERNRITYVETGNDKRHQMPSLLSCTPYLVLGYENGVIEVHSLSSMFSRVGKEEIEFYLNYTNLT